MIETERLMLRRFVERDRAGLRAMWADPRVMAYLGPVKDDEASDAAIARHQGYAAKGLGFLVVERREDGAMIGFCGLKPGNPATPIAGDVEVGWMMVADAWGNGYAYEAAVASIEWGWMNTPATRIVAITAARNAASRRLMDRLGMRHLARDDFDHADFAADDPLRATVVYALNRP